MPLNLEKLRDASNFVEKWGESWKNLRDKNYQNSENNKGCLLSTKS